MREQILSKLDSSRVQNRMAHTLPASFLTFAFAFLHFWTACLSQGDDASSLLAIKQAMGASSPNLTSWNSSSSPCSGSWSGVTCDAYNRVEKLNITSFDLSGPLSPEITALTSLTSLDISFNSITGLLPNGFEKLTGLQVLNISMNQLNGPFPQSLTSLTNLVELRIDNNFFTGAVPPQISNLGQLEQLWMGNNSMTGSLPASLTSLIHLRTLTAWGNQLYMQMAPEWAVWVNLTYLNLHNSAVFGTLPPEWGQNFTQLSRLLLNNNGLTGSIPPSWAGMKSLQQLVLKNNMLSGPVPAWVDSLEDKNATVQFGCNYLNGAPPPSFNSSTWQGNCFDNDLRAHTQKCDGKSCSEFASSSKKKSVVGVVVGIIIAAVVLCIIIAATWKFRKNCTASKHRRHNLGDDEEWDVPQGVRRYTYKEITKATKGFSQESEVGKGGFGKVYAGQTEDGKTVAIKRASDFSLQGTKEFRNEISLLSRLHHRHLVRLEGFCDDKDEQILVYEYMKNGNLHHHLFNKNAATLNWYRRLEIGVGVAQGLDYLHTFADPPVIHRDVKPSNILLDENLMAKVADFGISKANPEMDTHVSTRPAGTAGYLDPEYFLRRQLTTASDVYGYGVVLLELLTGQVAIDHTRFEDYNLVGWVRPKLLKRGVQGIIDPRIGPNYPVEAYTEVAQLAVQCTSFERAQRPSMQFIVTTLERIISTLTPPPEHFISYPPMSPRKKGTDSQGSTGTDVTGDGKSGYNFRESVLEPR